MHFFITLDKAAEDPAVVKNGIDLISEERAKQINKGKTAEADLTKNPKGQLSVAAGILAQKYIPKDVINSWAPVGWDYDNWLQLLDKPYPERLVIAGALIAAEIDRVTLLY
ncbi:MAG: hypothetical protein KF721_09910 [Ignavibacteriaceae bacterium]|nr:hypothetical protein [Ignavibacteriaceae bacterium]